MNVEVKEMQSVVESQADSMMMMIERAARDPQVDIEKLERLFALRERMIADQKKTAYAGAMVEAQKRMKPVYRDAVNNQTASPYARLESISDAIKPIYTEEGFSLSFDTAECPKENYIRIVCQVLHSSGHSELKHFDLPLDGVGIKGNPNKTAVQASGSTISYGRRYLTLMVFDVVLTNEDNDAQEDKKINPRGDLGKNVKSDLAEKTSIQMRDIMEADLDEHHMALAVYDKHMELCKDSDLYVAASDLLKSSERTAWKKLVKMAKQADKNEPKIQW